MAFLGVEVLLSMGILGALYQRQALPGPMCAMALGFMALVFSLFYGVPGLLASAVGGALLGQEVLNLPLRAFLAAHFVQLGWAFAALALVAVSRTQWENKVASTAVHNHILTRRLERLNLDLAQRDHALREIFEKVLVETESPRLLYHGFRRLRFSEDRETLFRDLLELLYSHCHVEKSCVYEPIGENKYRRVAVFGASQLPETLLWKSEDMPEILRVAAREKQVIVPKQLGPQFVMGIPIVNRDGGLVYVVLVEEIRFVNFSENIITLLKVAALWIRSLIEDRVARDQLIPYSRYRSVVVIAPEHAGKMLKERVRHYDRLGLPYTLLQCQGTLDEETCRILEMQLRLFDGLYLMDDTNLVIFLAMVSEPHVTRVVDRIAARFPTLGIRPVRPQALKA
ncbi:hypothetical protein SAMN02746041_00819 [Desulfacinum hydrothermale DSM 13146]|uniref:PelD GGDEF domain-containing protein n=1 Tax=Desulfacinum hydrothermale DSM 13146 TaxID=1121390 RepID=A0A1W1X8F3_9BACT|nr:hypothetical protein [Desulfacinum hydrothermale]SMC20110.1 hypothetical protein SAMN02746041_00819 [Desulfacinum hydrothermale DSM 13146]